MSKKSIIFLMKKYFIILTLCFVLGLGGCGRMEAPKSPGSSYPRSYPMDE